MICEAADKADLRKAFGAFATGVTVVTVGGDGSEPHGMTANSFTGVSLDPPLLLICIERDAVMHDALSTTGRFGVSVLASDQEEVARYFADRRRPLGVEEFEPVAWQPGQLTGTPLIAGALAQFECEVWRSYEGGDHTIFLGFLLSLERRTGDDALVFAHGKFCQISHEEGRLTP